MASLIAKSGHIVQNGRKGARDRELLFYSEVMPQLGLPHPEIYLSELDDQSGERWILMEDLAPRFRFPAVAHRLTWDEMKLTLRTYARFHAAGAMELPNVRNREWLFTYMEPDWNPSQVVEMSRTLSKHWNWGQLDGLDRLAQTVLDELPGLRNGPLTLLHHDAWPSNIGMPRSGESDGALIDWEMGGWGVEEIDLAYLYLSPYRNAGRIDQERALRYYWSERDKIDPKPDRKAHRRYRQWIADALFALSLLQTAAKTVQRPYPAGTPPQRFWDAMQGVLLEKFRTLLAR